MRVLDTGNVMRSISLWALFALMLTAGCSMSQAEVAKGAFLPQPDAACLKQLVPAIRDVTRLRHLKISENPFSESDTVVLTNHLRPAAGMNDPLVGVVGSEKIVRLVQTEGRCFVALIGETGAIVRKVPLPACRCRLKGAQ